MVKDKKSNFLAEFKRLFDWSVVCVAKPKPVYKEYADVGSVLLGYKVTVTYKHHGKKERFFACDECKLGLVSKERALDRANKFYEKTLVKEGQDRSLAHFIETLKHKKKCLFDDRILSVDIPYGSAKSLANVYKWTLVVTYEYKGRVA